MPRNRIDRDEVWAALRDLGVDPDQIANSLRDRGIKGNRNEPHSCPLANYLLREFQPVFAQKGLEPYISVGDNEVEVDGITVSISESPYAKFVERFDDGDYTKLAEDDDEQSASA